MNTEKIIKKISGYSYISFDIFDTLLKRNVLNPTDVFRLIEKLPETEERKLNFDFSAARIEAENIAKINAKNEEPTFHEIYSNFKELKGTEKEWFMKKELEAEKALIVKSRWFAPVYEYCLRHNKTIILTTDMYLPKEFLKEILNKEDIFYNHIYLSNEEKESKRKGGLFKRILTDLNIKSCEIIHIGDAKRADFLMPRRYGINSILIDKMINDLKYFSLEETDSKNSLSYSILSAFINNNLNPNFLHYEKIGYEVFGPLLYGFTSWLIHSFKCNGIDKVYFLSRDGYIIKEAFNILKKDCNIKDYYLYVSRRSLRVPLIWTQPDYENVLNNISLSKTFTVGSFIDRLGLDEKKYGILSDFKLEDSEIISLKDASKDNRLKSFYDGIKKDVFSNSRNQFENITGYFMNTSIGGKVAIVDIGWNGTMQDSISTVCKLSGIDSEIFGYYLGVKNTRDNKFGYIYDNINNPLANRLTSFGGLLESFFLGTHGSVKGYGKDFMPTFYDYEYAENDDIIKHIKNMQEGALKFIADFKAYTSALSFDIWEKEWYIKSILKLGTRPSLKDIKYFKKLYLYEQKKQYLISDKNFLFYLFHIKRLKYDFLNSFWKVGFMKNLFKIRLPYYQIYDIIKKTTRNL